MKKLILILCFIIAVNSMARAQTSLPPANPPKVVLDATTIVKDSTGHQYAYDEWTALLASRKFSLKRNGPAGADGKAAEYLIFHVSAANMQRMANQPRIPQKPKESEQFHAGDTFKPFNEKDINGQRFDLKKETGKVYVINFWFIGCPPCRAEIPDLNGVVDKYKDNKDVVFIAICLDDADAINNYTKILPFNYHMIDNGRSIAQKYGVHLYPTNLVINREGKVAFSSVSNWSSNPYWISKTIDEALAANVTAPAVPSK